MTSSPPSGSEAGASPSSSFEQLDEGVQRWIYRRQWQRLRDIQEEAIPLILRQERDLIVAAATAAGKTEAAFLPICSNLASDPVAEGLGALYISPLKALINDQAQRLDTLCEAADIELNSWHGDIPAKVKREVRKRPRGILLITPESLESIFVNHGTSAATLFGSLRYVVIDELHSFIGSERGRQLQSILHRIELSGRCSSMRVGLSATLGDMATAAEFMRPGSGDAVRLIDSHEDPRELRVQLRGYLARKPEEEPVEGDGEDSEGLAESKQHEIAAHLYGHFRGTDNLVFANSRENVEKFADILRHRCEQERVPTEFWPHHGNLSKALREDVEEMLREPSKPTTAICTSTLELGIDVGSVKCIGQIDPPFSAAALRQRLGRCGRKPEDPSILRMYVTESELDPGVWPGDALREGLVQSIAVVEALVEGWFEAPIDGALHLSTLVQQVLSVIAQHGGARADEIWTVLCGSGPFDLDRASFAQLLRGLAERDVIQQAGDEDLMLSPRGDQIVGHYSFYTAFRTTEEYRLIADGEELGSLPVSSPLTEDSFVIFGGRRWRVVEVDNDRKVIVVVAAKAGRVPRFLGAGGEIHDGIRKRMKAIYESRAEPTFLDSKALTLLEQGRRGFKELDLSRKAIVGFDGGSAYFPWAGDRVMATLALGIGSAGHHVYAEGLMLVAPQTPTEELHQILIDVFGPGEEPDPIALAGGVRNLETEKHHWLVDPNLLIRDCAIARLDIEGAKGVVTEIPSNSTTASRLSVPGTEFVVIDCETTGLHPSAHHRIIELAMITVNEQGESLDRWCSLLRPERDLGPTEVHGIRAREVLEAPSFDEVLGEVIDRIAGRVVVAHNARFDKAFLEHELKRSGVEVDPLPTICTMDLASRLNIGGARRRLADCCDALEVHAGPAHTALGDAEASKAILVRYLQMHGSSTVSLIDGRVQAAESWPRSDQRATPKERSPAFSEEQQQEQGSLSALIERAGLLDGEEATDNEAAYLNVLERAIEDRRLDPQEQQEMIATAAMLGIGEEHMRRLHHDYIARLVKVAWRDGEVTAREREDLFLVAEALGVADVAERLRRKESGVVGFDEVERDQSLAGKSVCFTGALVCRHEGQLVTRELATQLAASAGLTVLPRVTKKLDLLVVADPDSMSGKTRKAREYGVRVIAETAFWEMIGVEVS
ncbi:MAG TPA: DEAD/DEAH box helicase [Solirubrobacterales bacterium]